MFAVRQGTKCKVRRAGTNDEWQPFVTTRHLAFDSHGLADNGGTWTFTSGGWEMKVSPLFVDGRGPNPQTAGGEPRSRPVLSSKGRGSSRRRALKAARRNR